jgi:hypothetical protein
MASGVPFQVLSVFLSVGVAWSQQGAVAKTPQLSEEERDRLVAQAVVFVDDLVQGQPGRKQSKDAPPETAATDPVGDLDAFLGRVSKVQSPTLSKTLLRLLQLGDPALRATALHWLAVRPDIAAEALAQGLRDKHSLVRTVAEQTLFERGLRDESIAELKAEAKQGSEITLRQKLGAALRGSAVPAVRQ